MAEIPGVVAMGRQLQFKELLSACEGLSKGSTQQVKSSHEEEGFKGQSVRSVRHDIFDIKDKTPVRNHQTDRNSSRGLLIIMQVAFLISILLQQIICTHGMLD